MATKSNTDYWEKRERIMLEKILALENENTQLHTELATAKAKLSVYERLATISGAKTTLGFGPPINEEGRM